MTGRSSTGLRAIFELLQDGCDGSRLPLTGLREALRTSMHDEDCESVLQQLVQEGLITPARSDGTVALTIEGVKRIELQQ